MLPRPVCSSYSHPLTPSQDGIDVHFLNSTSTLEACRDPGAVRALFDSLEPNGITPTGDALELLLLQYMDDIESARGKKTKMPKKRNVSRPCPPSPPPSPPFPSLSQRAGRSVHRADAGHGTVPSHHGRPRNGRPRECDRGDGAPARQPECAAHADRHPVVSRLAPSASAHRTSPSERTPADEHRQRTGRLGPGGEGGAGGT